MATCTHLDQVTITELPEAVDGCEECLASGGQWFHLRICLSCGHVGCCDTSPGKHASGHARDSGHPIMRSLEPGRAVVVVLRGRARDDHPRGAGADAHPALAAGLSR